MLFSSADYLLGLLLFGFPFWPFPYVFIQLVCVQSNLSYNDKICLLFTIYMLLLCAVLTYLYLTEGIDSHVIIPYYICIYLPYLISIYLSVQRHICRHVLTLFKLFCVGVCNQGCKCYVIYAFVDSFTQPLN